MAAGHCRHHRCDQSERSRGRAISSDRTGGAVASRPGSGADGHLRVVHARRIYRDGARRADGRFPDQRASAGVVAGRQLSCRRRALRGYRRCVVLVVSESL